MGSFITKRASECGLTMEDAKEPLRIEVKPAHVAKGSLKNAKMCAFARACEEQLDVDAAFFFRSTAWLEKDGKLTRYTLPPSVQKEIVAFDRNRTMEPGIYQLSKPVKSATLVSALARSKKRPGRHHPAKTPTGIKRKYIHKTTNVRGEFDPTYRASRVS